jgi:hypothetical protein
MSLTVDQSITLLAISIGVFVAVMNGSFFHENGPHVKKLLLSTAASIVSFAIGLIYVFYIIRSPLTVPFPLSTEAPPPLGRQAPTASAQHSSSLPSPCDSAQPERRGIPFYLSVGGPPGISNADIEKSIEASLPPANFYAADRPDCAMLRINAKIGVAMTPKANGAMMTETAKATAEIEYISAKSGDKEMIVTSYSSDFVSQDYVENPIWPKRCTISESISRNLADRRVASLLAADFGIRFSGPLSAGNSTSHCGSG